MATELAARRGDRASVIAELEDLRAEMRSMGRSEDRILDLMDYVYGWCSPHEKSVADDVRGAAVTLSR